MAYYKGIILEPYCGSSIIVFIYTQILQCWSRKVSKLHFSLLLLNATLKKMAAIILWLWETGVTRVNHQPGELNWLTLPLETYSDLWNTHDLGWNSWKTTQRAPFIAYWHQDPNNSRRKGILKILGIKKYWTYVLWSHLTMCLLTVTMRYSENCLLQMGI